MSFARQIDEQRYREQTERQASMPGVMSPTFRCVACRCKSGTKGRKRTAVGTICADCHRAREARRARSAQA